MIKDKNLQEILLKISTNGYIDILLKDGFLTIRKRPAYCDRGNFDVKVFPNNGQFDLYIDGADMFPRYYFDYTCMMKEISLWIAKRNQQVPGASWPIYKSKE